MAKQTYQVIENNAGGMYLFFLKGDRVLLGLENIEYAQPGDLDNISLKEAKTWDSRLDDPQATYDDFHGFDFGWSVVADQNGIYPDRMGSAARIIFNQDE